MFITKNELAGLAGKTYRQLYNINKELPEDGKLFVENEEGKCDAALFVQRWTEYNARKSVSRSGACDICYGKTELAEIAGYSLQRLREIDEKLPRGKKLFTESESGGYDIKNFVQNWVLFNIGLAAASAGDDLDAIKAQHEKVKMRKTELEVARMEGELISLTDIDRLWADITGTLVSNFLRLSAKVAPRLVMEKSSEVIAEAIDGEVRAILEGISKTPVPDWIKTEDEDGDEDGDDIKDAAEE